MAKRGRKPGTPKTGGRKAGTPNKQTQSFRESLDSLGFDVAAEAVELYRYGDVPPSLKVALLEMIASYTLYKPKPPEESQNPMESVPHMSDEDAIKAVKG